MRSGGGDFAFEFSERLAESGAAVHVITSDLKGIARSKRFGLSPAMEKWSWPELPTLLRIARSFRPDVVEIHFAGVLYRHHPMVTFLPGLLKRLFPAVRVVLFIEYPDPIVSKPRTLAARIVDKLITIYQRLRGIDPGYGTMLRESDGVILLCEPHRQLLPVKEGLAEKCRVIAPPPPILISDAPGGLTRATERARLGLEETDFLLGYYGYVYPNKGLETLIDAFARVASKSARLLIIGGSNDIVLQAVNRPNYISELKERVASRGLGERVIWTDYFPAGSDQPSRLLRAVDACVLPYDDGVLRHRSTMGVVAAHHLPIVTTRGEHLEDVFVDGTNVLLAQAKDPESLARKIETVMADSALRDRLAQGSAQLARDEFSWDRCLKRTLAVFRGENGAA